MTTKTQTKRTTKRATAKKQTRKTAAKKSSKKTTAKKGARASKKEGKQPLVHATGKECFWVHNGPVLTNLMDLHEALSQMDVESYEYHAKGETNDFAEWVERVLGDNTCASALRRAKKQATAVTVVKRHLARYTY